MVTAMVTPIPQTRMSLRASSWGEGAGLTELNEREHTNNPAQDGETGETTDTPRKERLGD
jgi:hypothetical protein